MKTIDVESMKSGDSKSEFEKINDTEIMEYVVQVRKRNIATIQTQANEIDQATISRQERILKDNAHTAKLREMPSLNTGDKVIIENTHQ